MLNFLKGKKEWSSKDEHVLADLVLDALQSGKPREIALSESFLTASKKLGRTDKDCERYWEEVGGFYERELDRYLKELEAEKESKTLPKQVTDHSSPTPENVTSEMLDTSTEDVEVDLVPAQVSTKFIDALNKRKSEGTNSLRNSYVPIELDTTSKEATEDVTETVETFDMRSDNEYIATEHPPRNLKINLIVEESAPPQSRSIRSSSIPAVVSDLPITSESGEALRSQYFIEDVAVQPFLNPFQEELDADSFVEEFQEDSFEDAPLSEIVEAISKPQPTEEVYRPTEEDSIVIAFENEQESNVLDQALGYLATIEKMIEDSARKDEEITALKNRVRTLKTNSKAVILKNSELSEQLESSRDENVKLKAAHASLKKDYETLLASISRLTTLPKRS